MLEFKVNDKDKFLELLNSFGFSQRDINWSQSDTLTHKEYFIVKNHNREYIVFGEGYFNKRFCEFIFDSNGKFYEHSMSE